MTRANNEPLTPERVRSAAFSSSRLGRRGLDEGEVYAFCGWVSDELAGLLNDNAMLEAEVRRLRARVLEGGSAKSGVQPEDAHVQAVYVLSKAQQTADRYVADAQEYSRELAQDAHSRRDEILREAKVRASMILEEAHASGSRAASAVQHTSDPLPGSERQELQAEIAYLRTFSDVCRTHLRAYMDSLSRSIAEWERAEHEGALAAKASIVQSSPQALSRALPGGVGAGAGEPRARVPGALDDLLRRTFQCLRPSTELSVLSDKSVLMMGRWGAMPRS